MKIERLFLARHASSFRAAVDVETADIRAPREREVLVRNHWAGINGLFDTVCAAGTVPTRSVTVGNGLGVEATGVVEAVGEGVTDFHIGDAVSSTAFGGAYATHQVAPVSKLRKISSPSAEACAIRPTGTSARVALHEVGRLQSSDTAAIVAAAGGLGHFAVQVAKRAGARVIAICGSERKAAFVRSLGAELVLNHRTDDVARVIDTFAPGGLDVVMETTGGPLRPLLLDRLAVRGRFLICGSANSIHPQDQVPAIDPLPSIYWKSATIAAFQNALYPEFDKAAADDLFGAFERRELVVKIDERQFQGIGSIPDAVEHLLSGESIGKVVVRL